MTSAADSTAASAGEPTARSQVFTRRTLLTAGAGLVVGAGLTQGGNLIADRPTGSPAHRPPTPGEDLMTEHGLLKRLLLAYQAASAQLAAGRTPQAGAITQAAQIIGDYIEGFHEGLEEAYVFPRVRSAQPALIATLLTQHDRGRHLTAAITAAVAGDLTSVKTRTALRRYLDLFVRMYSPHEAWEDTVIFPALRELTPQRTLDQLAERFAELETRQYGADALAKMLGRVASIEKQLGIDELASFTPPEIHPS